jgi:restriction endonuclease S subunit
MIKAEIIPEGFKQTSFGSIPSDWEVKKFKEILKEGKVGGNYENAEANTGIPVIKMGNLDRGVIKVEKIQYLPEDEKFNKEDILKEGDLLFNTRNTLELVGKVAIWKNELPFAVYNSNLMRMKFDEKYVASNWFINYVFNSHPVLSQLRGIATGTTSVAAIYGRDLDTIKFVLPSLPEQKAIAHILGLMDTAINKNNSLIAKNELQKKWLMQNLLTGKKRLKGFTEDWKEYNLGEMFSERNETRYFDTPKENSDSLFFTYLFKTLKLMNLFWRNSQGLVDDTLNCKFKDFSIVKIQLPKKEEQSAIAHILQSADKEIQLLKTKAEKLKEQKKGLMQVLLTGRKRLRI